MISVLKILFTVLVIVVVILGFKYRWRLADMTRAAARMAGVDPAKSGGARSGPPAVRDLVPCARCGAYVAAGTPCSCGKP